MAIRLQYIPTSDNLQGRSKFLGSPDLPDTLPYPTMEIEEAGERYSNPLSFICQIRCEEIAEFDTQNLLPHEGMLYFFGEVDYFFGHRDYASPGMGEWPAAAFRVLYTPDCSSLHTHTLVDEDGRDLAMKAEAIRFSLCNDAADGFKLLGTPFFEEIEACYPGWVSLLQLDCDDSHNLQFYDSGMLSFLLPAADLKTQRFEVTQCFLHSL